MESWTLVLLTLCVALLLPYLAGAPKRRRLPPGPPVFPIIGNLLWLRTSISGIEALLRRLKSQYGPIITLHIGSRPAIFVTDRSLAHKLLVQHGAVLAHRPPLLEVPRLLSSNGYNINNAGYGPVWRLFRRNLISEILHPSRVKLYSHGREWVLEVLLHKLKQQAEERDGVVVVMESFQYAMFCLLVLMCFGEKLEEERVWEIAGVQRDLLLYLSKIQVFAFFPRVGKYVFPGRWKGLLDIRRRQKDVLLLLVNARRDRKKTKTFQAEDNGDNSSFCYSYVDSLLDLEIPEEGNRRLTDDEIVALCSEFLNAGTDTTSTALQWIMANVVKYPHIQSKLMEEINGTVDGASTDAIQEEDLQRMPYLKAVVTEGLRRHPPGHFVLPHAVTEETEIEGHLIPKNATINFTVADMGWDAEAWSDPLEFKPERFLPGGEGEGVDITGSREIKMMPFGVGRRICPGLGLAMLHLEYFVGNLVREFEWKAVDGEEVDLEEKPEFTIVMKSPLRAKISSRLKV